MSAFVVDIRDRRQITVPKAVLSGLGLSIGDKLLFDLKGQKVQVKPVINKINDTLKAINQAFKDSGVTKKDLLSSGVKIRKKLLFEKYGIKE